MVRSVIGQHVTWLATERAFSFPGLTEQSMCTTVYSMSYYLLEFELAPHPKTAVILIRVSGLRGEVSRERFGLVILPSQQNVTGFLVHILLCNAWSSFPTSCKCLLSPTVSKQGTLSKCVSHGFPKQPSKVDTCWSAIRRPSRDWRRPKGKE